MGAQVTTPADGQAGDDAVVRGERGVAPNPEVRPGGRRRFTRAYKQRIVAEAERCGPGEVGALLRREGLYSSHLAKWRQLLRSAGAGAASEEIKTVRQELTKAERENRRLRQRLEQAQTIIAVQKKLSSLLQIGSLEADS